MFMYIWWKHETFFFERQNPLLCLLKNLLSIKQSVCIVKPKTSYIGNQNFEVTVITYNINEKSNPLPSTTKFTLSGEKDVTLLGFLATQSKGKSLPVCPARSLKTFGLMLIGSTTTTIQGEGHTRDLLQGPYQFRYNPLIKRTGTNPPFTPPHHMKVLSEPEDKPLELPP